MTALKNILTASSFEEKSVWIQLTGLTLVLGGYIAAAGMLLAEGGTDIGPFIPLFIGATILLVAFQAAGHAVAAATSRSDLRDERDRLIAWRAEARSSWVLGAGLIGGVGCLMMAVDAVWVANILLLSLFLSQMLCGTLQIVAHRRGL